MSGSQQDSLAGVLSPLKTIALREKIWGQTAGFVVYGFAAIFFLVFSALFVRWYGTAVYGQFSLMFNTLSALTLFGNYHNVIVSYSITSDIRKYQDFRKTALLYSALMAVPATWIFLAIGRISIGYAPALWISFLVLIFCGLPSSAILATQRNYLFTVARGFFQVSLIGFFWFLFANSQAAILSFVVAFFLISIVNLICLNCIADRTITFRAEAVDPPPRIMFAAFITNVSLIATLLVDKFALSVLHVDTPEERGVYLIFYDVIVRLTSVFVILLPALTYHLLESAHERGRLLLTVKLSLLVCVLMALLAALVGALIPFLYGLKHADPILGATFAAYIGFFGVTTFIVAYCSANGFAWAMTMNYLLILIVTLGALIVVTFSNGAASVTGLAVSMAIGQAVSLITGGYLLLLAFRKLEARREPH